MLPSPWVAVVAGLVLVWAALVLALLLLRPRGARLTDAVRLLPDLLRLLPRLARDPRCHLACACGCGCCWPTWRRLLRT